MANINLFNEEVGLLRRGAIDHYSSDNDIIYVKLNGSSTSGANRPVEVPAPHSMFYNNGLFIGTLPQPGTPVVIALGSGGQYYFVSFLAENLNKLPELTLGELLIKSNDNTRITLDTSNNINIGSLNRVHINTKLNYISTNFENSFKFTQATRSVNGVVKRDKILNNDYDHNSKLESDIYDDQYYVIGMDPSASTNSITSGTSKNPPLVENRNITYEFQYKSNVLDDLTELSSYTDKGVNSINTQFDRRLSRADTLSLSLKYPNYLMESTKGTVVDIFGNILDINRNPLPVGKDTATIRSDKSKDLQESYIKIKELERKSIAYHFELNARKDLSGSNGLVLPDINSNADYARNRSRLSVDLDKEGQFKINIPASSDKGNIPLLARYENFSSLQDNTSEIIFRDDNRDILLDSFAAPEMTLTPDGVTYSSSKGSIEVKDGDGIATPIDRITGEHIKHGTAFHDVLKTCYVHQDNSFLDYQADSDLYKTIDISKFTPLANVVSKTIYISGDLANAGGRSGTISLDGSIEVSIGANSIDRQSMWLDMAGGFVANIGRDIKNMSMALSMNGDTFIQIGGIGVSGDTRFDTQDNGSIGAIFDLRVVTDGGYVNIFRVDKYGVTVMTPGSLSVHAKQNVQITAGADMKLEAETLTIQGRPVLKEFGGSI